MDNQTTSAWQEMVQVQAAQGAVFKTVSDRSIPITFGQRPTAIAAAKSGVAVCDRSHWGRIAVADGDRLRFLHNQSTNSFMTLQPGQGCETVFVTSTARTIDLVSAYVRLDSVLLLTHPSCRETLIKWMDRFIFFADKVKLIDETDDTVALSLIGPESSGLLNHLGIDLEVSSSHHHQTVTIEGVEVLVAVGSGLALPGYTLITSSQQAATLWQTITQAGAIPLGEAGWEYLRIEQGRPTPGAELTETYNPLEAGLWHTITFDKGCYIGQETIARLDTYNGVKQQLWGIRLSQMVEPETPLWLDGKKVGSVTSVIAPNTSNDSDIIGLAYVRTKAGGAGLTLQVGEAASGITAMVIDVPFLTRSRQNS